jgi:hypothetical protein
VLAENNCWGGLLGITSGARGFTRNNVRGEEFAKNNVRGEGVY